MPSKKRKNAEQEAEHDAKQAAQEASPWVDRFARFGYATKGTVYLVVGTLAIVAAIGMGGRTTDPPGAFQAARQEAAYRDRAAESQASLPKRDTGDHVGGASHKNRDEGRRLHLRLLR